MVHARLVLASFLSKKLMRPYKYDSRMTESTGTNMRYQLAQQDS